MTFGIDLDGVLGDFTKHFNKLVLDVLGKTLPYPAEEWDWHLAHGVTQQENEALWKGIVTWPEWWSNLPPFPTTPALLKALDVLRIDGHTVYIVTARPGSPQEATQAWVDEQCLQAGVRPIPVILTPHKGALAEVLPIDLLVDDLLGNLRSCSPRVKKVLVAQPYNLHIPRPVEIERVALEDLAQHLHKEASHARATLA